MCNQSLPNLQIENEKHRLTLSLYNENIENIKNAIHQNTLSNYIVRQNLIPINFKVQKNIMVCDTFIMVDLREQNFTYNSVPHHNTFKDSFIGNKFYEQGVFPIFYIKDLFIDTQNTDCPDFVAKNIEKIAKEIIFNIM